MSFTPYADQDFVSVPKAELDALRELADKVRAKFDLYKFAVDLKIWVRLSMRNM